jgi:hydrogenase maturation protease
MKTLIGGVGYHNLRDLSLGPTLTAQLAAMVWPAQVEIDADLSFGPIAIVQRFQAQPDLYRRIVLFAAVNRGRAPGSVTAYRWKGKLPPADEIQARIGEAVTGVVSLDNLLIIGEHFGIWPEEVVVVEVEPADEGWGQEFSPTVAAVVDDVLGIVRRAALEGENGAL